MTKKTGIHLGNHCTFLMHVPLVFVARYRLKIFDQDAIEKLRSDFGSVCADFDVEWIEMDSGEITFTYWPTTSQNCQYQLWSTASKGCPADC